MTDKRVIPVVGATGAQGGGMGRAILGEPDIPRQFVDSTNEEYCARRDVGFSRSLNPRLQSFAEWLADNKDRLPGSSPVGEVR